LASNVILLDVTCVVYVLEESEWT